MTIWRLPLRLAMESTYLKALISSFRSELQEHIRGKYAGNSKHDNCTKRIAFTIQALEAELERNMKSASKTAEMDGTKAAAMHGNMKQLERAESDRSLNEEHKSIKKLFGNYHAAEMKDRDDIAEDIILALHNHVCFEEQLLRYPVVATSVGETELLDRLFENQSKVNLAIDNLRKLFTDLDVSQYNDKMLQLEQCFDAHVDLAEKCMIPEFREKGIDFRELNDPAAQLCLPSEESSFPRHRFQPGIAAPEG